MQKTTNVGCVPPIAKRNSNDASASGTGYMYQILFACILVLSCILLKKQCFFEYIEQENYEDVAIINTKEIIQFQLKYQSSPLSINDFMKTTIRTLAYKKSPQTYFVVYNKTGKSFSILEKKFFDHDFMRKFLLLKLNFPKLKNLRINMSKNDLNKLYSNNYRGMKNKPKNLMDCKLSKKYLQMFHFRTGLSMDEAEKEINDLLYKKYNNFIKENKNQEEIRRELLFGKLKKIIEHAVVNGKRISIKGIEKRFTKLIKNVRENLELPLTQKDNEIKQKDNEIKKVKLEKDNEIKQKDNEIEKLKKQLRKLKK